MLYSETKERENRFIIALKIVFPFLCVMGVFVYFFDTFSYTLETSLFIFLIVIYVYYIFYLIYYGFKSTLIDPITKAFTCKKMEALIDACHPKNSYTLALLHVDNMVDINERYGFMNGDRVLKTLVIELHQFLIRHGLKNVPIGRCGGTLMMVVSHPLKEFSHLLRCFIKEIGYAHIHEMEVKLLTTSLPLSYDRDVKNVIERLFLGLEELKKNENQPLEIKPNDAHAVVRKAIEKEQVHFKYQPALHVKENQITLFEALPYIETKEYGILLKQHIQYSVNYAGCERLFDETVLALVLKNASYWQERKKVLCVDISAVTLRNAHFLHFFKKYVLEHSLDVSFIMLEFSEQNGYEDIGRFRGMLGEYKALGCKIALGNFGGRNASVEYLKYLPIDMVKFDIEFTKKIDDKAHASLLRHYIELSRDLDILTMVKFVDKEELFEKIKGFNPDFIQGFYVSKPKKIGELSTSIL